MLFRSLHKDPAYKTARIFLDNYQQSVEPYFKTFNAANFALNHLYQKGILEQKKGQEYYPDANFTMRISYGNVKSYSPKDAVKYSEVCTTRGILEKYKPGDYEFDAPSKLIDLIQTCNSNSRGELQEHQFSNNRELKFNKNQKLISFSISAFLLQERQVELDEHLHSGT